MSVNSNFYVYILVTAFYLIHASWAADKFYVIAHMVNDDRTAGWALGSGANAVEMDINFDGNSGKPTRFHHGTACDCTCLLDIFVAGSVCHLPQACKGGANVNQQLTFLLKFPALALIYIDSKTSDLSDAVQKKAGKEIVNTLETQLFVKGYRGKVLIGSGNEKAYIVAAATQAKLSPYASKFYFTLDQDRSGVVKNLEFLTSLPVSNILYSTGISACAASTYYSEIGLAGINKGRGVVSNVFIWTLDKSASFDKYFTAGARGILTNRVPKLVDWAKAKGLQLATPGDDSLPPATTKTIARDLGTCDCNYHPGGCSVSKAAPANAACKCAYKGAWTCGGTVVACRDQGSVHCRNPDTSPSSCIQGGGDCAGYGSKNCDCDYHPGGCSISKVSPKGTACKCVYKGAWTCSGEITRCIDEGSSQCRNPDTTPSSCIQGGGDCGGYGTKNCDCDYHPGGCSISKASPRGTACKCSYKGAWTCGGVITRCRDEGSSKCQNPDTSIQACFLGGGDCEGYKIATCDCDYVRKGWLRSSGCKIVSAPPRHTACKCRYKGAWTCDGVVVRCGNPNSRYCTNPDKSRETCSMGGGDCAGY